MNVMEFFVDVAVKGGGKLIFVAGSPSVGKSNLMTLTAKTLASCGVPVGNKRVFTLSKDATGKL